MLNRWSTLPGIFAFFFIFFVASAALGQNVEVLKAELKGTERRLDTKIDGATNQLDTKIDGATNQLDTKIDGVKNELNTKIDGVKNELNASINGVKSGVTVIQWIIGGIGAVFTIFLGFLGYLLNYFVKQVLPNMIQQESKDRGDPPTNQSQKEKTDKEEYTDSMQPDYTQNVEEAA